MVRPVKLYSSRGRPSGDPSVRWLLRRLSLHIRNSSRIFQADNDDYEFLQTMTVNLLNQLREERYFSSHMFERLYNTAMDLIRNERSDDIHFVEGMLEGDLQITYGDEL